MTHSVRLPGSPIRVLIVAPDNMMGELLTGAFNQSRRDFVLSTLVGSSHAVVARLGAYETDVAVISAELQDGPLAGLNVLQGLRNVRRRVAAVMLLKTATPESVVSAFREGARGLFYRDRSLKALSKCIRTVHEGQIWASNEDIEHLISAVIHTKPLEFHDAKGMALLTRREEDVVRLVADGLRNCEIALKLNVTEHSVRNYLYRILDKLGLSTRVELILYAVSQREQNWNNLAPRRKVSVGEASS
jgi:DNA-binding NarL/FixJ family response regulator